MLFSLHAIKGYALHTTEALGSVKDSLFDDRTWTVRYFVVDTGTWLPGRQVLISPAAAGTPDWDTHTVPTNLTTEQVEQSPPVEEDMPVSRSLEAELAAYYGWIPYWETPYPLFTGLRPTLTEDPRAQQPEAAPADPTLRSVNEVTGYRVEARDGEIGHVEDFIADTEGVGWRIRYLVVDTRNWLPGRKVLIAPEWIRTLDWGQRHVTTDHRREEIENAPPYDPSAPVNREYEIRLYDYYGRPTYW